MEERDYVSRVEKEKKKLDKKISKLSVFILSEKFVKLERKIQDLLGNQLRSMNNYSLNLRDRLVLMKKES
jgi:hypothetical protein